jgi:hypothetical protein
VVAGVDGLAMAELAGLDRSEEPPAHDLFDRVIDELGRATTFAGGPGHPRVELVRWWGQLSVLPPEVPV